MIAVHVVFVLGKQSLKRNRFKKTHNVEQELDLYCV